MPFSDPAPRKKPAGCGRIEYAAPPARGCQMPSKSGWPSAVLGGLYARALAASILGPSWKRASGGRTCATAGSTSTAALRIKCLIQASPLRFRRGALWRVYCPPVIALSAFLLPEFEARLRDAVERHADLPGLAIRFWIFDGGLVVDGVRRGARIALDHVERLAVRVPGRIEPRFGPEIGHVDHQRVALPTADRIAQPQVNAIQVGARSGLDDALVVHVLVHEHDVSGPLQNLKRERHVGDPRHAGHGAMRDGIDARAFLFPLERFREVRNLMPLGDFGYVETGCVSRHPDSLEVGFSVGGARDRLSQNGHGGHAHQETGATIPHLEPAPNRGSLPSRGRWCFHRASAASERWRCANRPWRESPRASPRFQASKSLS